jgi:hypothetical protein
VIRGYLSYQSLLKFILIKGTLYGQPFLFELKKRKQWQTHMACSLQKFSWIHAFLAEEFTSKSDLQKFLDFVWKKVCLSTRNTVNLFSLFRVNDMSYCRCQNCSWQEQYKIYYYAALLIPFRLHQQKWYFFNETFNLICI